MTEPTTDTLTAPGAVLHYDVRSAGAPAAHPVLLIIGSPMGAAGFVTLAGHFTDRTDGALVTTPDEFAATLRAALSES